ncbi:MAG: phospholipase [Acidobacteriota bacterium]|nr:phospholipase [Acidobacteriota bacterium]
MRNEVDVHLIATTTHGRVLVREAHAAAARGVLVGFHGYMEQAAIQMERLQSIPGAARWRLVSIQALHRFYRGRSEDVVASWMTREDRERAIADNIEYVDAALDAVPHDPAGKIVFAGFSQGVAMAFRAALLGRRGAAGVIAVGGDVPPELLAAPQALFPPVLLARGVRDAWLTAEAFRRDLNALTGRVPGSRVRGLEFEGAHEWSDAVAEPAADFLASL